MTMTALVTGGSNGIGEGICRAFLARGYRVINVDIQPPRGSECIYVNANLADPTETRQVATRIAHEYPVDVIVNNAGNPTPGFLDEVTDQQFETGVAITM